MSVTNTAPARAAVDYLKTGGIVAAVAARDFVRTGLVMTAVGMVLLVVFALTYWSWMGYLVKAARARRAVPRANTGARSAKVVH